MVLVAMGSDVGCGGSQSSMIKVSGLVSLKGMHTQH